MVGGVPCPDKVANLLLGPYLFDPKLLSRWRSRRRFPAKVYGRLDGAWGQQLSQPGPDLLMNENLRP